MGDQCEGGASLARLLIGHHSTRSLTLESIISANPFRCRMWDMHDRLDSHITVETCRDEIDSVSKHGQHLPALGRRLHGNSAHDFELIYGARRLFIAQHLNVPLLVEIKALSDKQALIAMDIENRVRKDISPYERGLSYLLWLRYGHFDSQDDIASSLRISASQVSRLIKLAKLPAVVIESFGNPLAICEAWGTRLYAALQGSRSRQALIATARAIAASSTTTTPDAVYRQLLVAAAGSRPIKHPSHDEIVRGPAGNPLFRIRQQQHSIALVLPMHLLKPRTKEAICKSVADILHDANAEVLDLIDNGERRNVGQAARTARHWSTCLLGSGVSGLLRDSRSQNYPSTRRRRTTVSD